MEVALEAWGRRLQKFVQFLKVDLARAIEIEVFRQTVGIDSKHIFLLTDVEESAVSFGARGR
jgi:hypothetical protein